MEIWYRAMLFGERVAAAAPTTAGKALRKVDMSDGGNGEGRGEGEEERWYSRATLSSERRVHGPVVMPTLPRK